MTAIQNTTRATRLLLVLTLLNVLNFADRYLIISFSNVIIPELGLSHLQFGLLTGLVFTAVYTVVGLFAGSLADRYDRTKVIGVGLMLWSGVTAATGFSRNFLHMALARMFVGVGEASLTPAAVSMLADAFPPARRALVSGVYYLGLPVGVGGSFLYAAAVGPSLGWRGAFLLLGVLGAAAAVLVLLFLRDPPRIVSAAPVQGENKKSGMADSFRALGQELRNNPAFVFALIGATAFTFVHGAGILDLVWWINERGYAPAAAQKISGVIFLFGGTLGAVLGGIGGDWAYRKTPAGRLKFLAWVSVVSLPLILAYRLAPAHSAAFYVFATSGAILSMLMFGPLFSVVQELVAPAHRAAAVALFLLCGALIGAGGGNATAGLLSDLFRAQGSTAPITETCLWMSLGCLISIPAFFAAAHFQAKAHAEKRSS